MSKKRKDQLDHLSDDLDEDTLTPTQETSKRARRASTKQKALDNATADKQVATIERLKKKARKLSKKLAAAEKKNHTDGTSSGAEESGDPDCLPCESEDDDEPGGVVSLGASIRPKKSTPLRNPVTPSIQRREGDRPRLTDGTITTAVSALAVSVHQETGNNVFLVSENNGRPTEILQPHINMPQLAITTNGLPQVSDSLEPARHSSFTSIDNTGGFSSPSPLRHEQSSSLQLISRPTVQALVPPIPHSHVSAASLPSLSTPIATTQAAPFANGITPSSNSRPKASDYAEDVKALLLEAIEVFATSIYVTDAFPGVTKQHEFAARAWQQVCNDREELVTYELSDRMIRIITARKSNARGDVCDLIRPLIPSTYKFRLGTSKSTERYNIGLQEMLMSDGTFHHKTYNVTTGERWGFAENRFILRVIRLAFFPKVNNGIGYKFPDLFNPIPVETVAFVLTAIHATIAEWETGKHVAANFTEVANQKFYRTILADLKKWGDTNPTAWTNIRKKWYQRAYREGGGTGDHTVAAHVSEVTMSTAQAELAARTGLTDSEGEGDGDDDDDAGGDA